MNAARSSQLAEANGARARQLRATEFIATALLSLGAIATSWSGYQAALWSGIQAMHYSRASSSRVEATREFTTSGQVEMVDVSLFMSWVNAYAVGNEPLQKFYRDRFRHEFVPAFEEWLASTPWQNPNAAPTPFTSTRYRIATRERALQLEREAEEEFRKGERANDISDKYVLNSVFLAVALFFAGIAQQFHMVKVRLGMLSLSALLLIAGFVNILSLPRA